MKRIFFNLQRFTETIKLTNGDDDYFNVYKDVKIFALAGNDSINNFFAADVEIYLGNGNDSVLNDGPDVTISGGKGNDVISENYHRAQRNLIKYASGDGNDTVYGFNSDDTLQITKGSFSTIKSGDDFVVNVGKGKILLKDALADGYNKITIKNSSGKVVTYNDWKIWNGTKGNDEFKNYSSKVTLYAKSGNDSIYSYGGNVTISGGKGNDVIYGYNENNLFKYASGDGNDTISGFDSDDTLYITKGSYKVTTSGNDVIVTVGKGKITLKDAKGKSISIKNSKGKVTTKVYGYSNSKTAELFAENNFVTADITPTTKNPKNVIK